MKGQTREEKRRAWLWAIAIVAAMIGVIALILWVPTWPLWEGSAELRPVPQAVTDASAGLDSITVDAVFEPDSRLVSVEQVMTLRNRTGQTQDSVVLRSYSGAYLKESTSPAALEEIAETCYPSGFNAGGAVFSALSVNGKSVARTFLDDACTVLSLPVEGGWAAGADVTVRLVYEAAIPECASRFGESSGIWALGNLFPTLAVWEDGAWRTDAYSRIGDPFLSDCANWTVRLTAPRSYTAAASAYGEPVTLGDSRVWTWRAQAVRDFAVTLSEEYQAAQGMAGDVLVTAYAKDGSAARTLMKAACKAVEVFGTHYGTLDYPCLTVAEVDFPFGGMEYPQLVFIGSSTVTAGGSSLELTVAHEAAHQWWYALIGSDSVNQPWQDESLAEYAMLDYIGAVYGADDRESYRRDVIEAALTTRVDALVTSGSPITYFGSLSDYTTVVYRRGAALWTALENLLGKEELDRFLTAYHTAYRFQSASRQDLTELLQSVTGRDVTALITDYLDVQTTE